MNRPPFVALLVALCAVALSSTAQTQQVQAPLDSLVLETGSNSPFLQPIVTAYRNTLYYYALTGSRYVKVYDTTGVLQDSVGCQSEYEKDVIEKKQCMALLSFFFKEDLMMLVYNPLIAVYHQPTHRWLRDKGLADADKLVQEGPYKGYGRHSSPYLTTVSERYELLNDSLLYMPYGDNEMWESPGRITMTAPLLALANWDTSEWRALLHPTIGVRDSMYRSQRNFHVAAAHYVIDHNRGHIYIGQQGVPRLQVYSADQQQLAVLGQAGQHIPPGCLLHSMRPGSDVFSPRNLRRFALGYSYEQPWIDPQTGNIYRPYRYCANPAEVRAVPRSPQAQQLRKESKADEIPALYRDTMHWGLQIYSPDYQLLSDTAMPVPCLIAGTLNGKLVLYGRYHTGSQYTLHLLPMPAARP